MSTPDSLAVPGSEPKFTASEREFAENVDNRNKFAKFRVDGAIGNKDVKDTFNFLAPAIQKKVGPDVWPTRVGILRAEKDGHNYIQSICITYGSTKIYYGLESVWAEQDERKDYLSYSKDLKPGERIKEVHLWKTDVEISGAIGGIRFITTVGKFGADLGKSGDPFTFKLPEGLEGLKGLIGGYDRKRVERIGVVWG
jgi:hypothetical protein